MKGMYALLALASAGPAWGSLIVNGSFEQPSVSVAYYSAGSTAITGFTVVALPGGGDIQLTNNSAFGNVGSVASDGQQYLLTGNVGRGGGIRTDAFSTSAGQTYRASFDLGAIYIAGYGSFGDAIIDAYVNDSFVGSFKKLQTLSSAGSDYGRFGFEFSGDGEPTTLSFYSSLDSSSSNLGVLFDNLSVEPVPEPATWAMMLMGFGLIGGMIRRKPVTTERPLA